MVFNYQVLHITPYLQTEESMIMSFEKVAAIGYRYVQLQGVPLSISDAVIERALKNNRLKCIATQEDIPNGLLDTPDRYIERAVACEAHYLTFALLPKDVDTKEKIAEFAEKINLINEKVNHAGLILAYHPVGRDFQTIDNTPIYDLLLSYLPQNVQLAFCVHSTFGSGVHHSEVFKKHRGRVDLVHFKDSILLSENQVQLVPLGQGRTDWRPITTDCIEANVKWIFAEQERWTKDAFASAEDSFQYLKGIF